MKIGIFGGAFNPIHNGHLHLAEAYFNELKLDKLILIPTAKPPHKSDASLISSDDRINMLRLATKDKPYEISTIELEREGLSYTYDTLVELKAIYPNDDFYLIIGADQLFYFDKWYMFREILSMVTLCTLARESEEEREQMLSYAKENSIDNIQLLDIKPIKVSSTQIRNAISQGESVDGLLPNSVIEYIKEKGLYL